MKQDYDIIVVGAGHAGCEAAAVAANMGARVLLVTMNMQTIGQMSCNPAMGGVAKGQIVREIDAFGGYSGIVSDKTRIQFRMLNRSKGPAMWSPRTQNDRMLFAWEWRQTLEAIPNIDFWQDMVKGLLVKDNSVCGIKTGMGIEFTAQAVVLTNGTFLNGIIHIGEKQFGGGRMGDAPATGITEQLHELGFESGRMKTGTPPRLDGRSINYSVLEEQPGDDKPGQFSFLNVETPQKQRSCHIAYTSPEVHETLKTGFEKSPMFSGRIKGVGPRYCPSIEDKIDRFAERDRHQLFVEPEGWDTVEVYLNGFSSSLPEDVQYKALQKIPGFEKVKMFRPGYAIEYDYFPTWQIGLNLETHKIKNLFFAGQINGTTGYEEAACQGLMAGINAVLKIRNEKPFILTRSEAYIGVLIDDLVNKGTNEPYRMFTSRAEFRISLRQDNADLRLTPLGYHLGTVDQNRWFAFQKKKQDLEKVFSILEKTSAEPHEVNEWLQNSGTAPITWKTRLDKILLRPQVNIFELAEKVNALRQEMADIDSEVMECAEIGLKYQGYVQKEHENAEKLQKLESFALSKSFDYSRINSLSAEAREKLMKIKPETLGQASRISGVSPADISVLMVYFGR